MPFYLVHVVDKIQFTDPENTLRATLQLSQSKNTIKVILEEKSMRNENRTTTLWSDKGNSNQTFRSK